MWEKLQQISQSWATHKLCSDTRVTSTHVHNVIAANNMNIIEYLQL